MCWSSLDFGVMWVWAKGEVGEGTTGTLAWHRATGSSVRVPSDSTLQYGVTRIWHNTFPNIHIYLQLIINQSRRICICPKFMVQLQYCNTDFFKLFFFICLFILIFSLKNVFSWHFSVCLPVLPPPPLGEKKKKIRQTGGRKLACLVNSGSALAMLRPL